MEESGHTVNRGSYIPSLNVMNQCNAYQVQDIRIRRI